MRCFVAVDLPEELVEEFEAVQTELDPAEGVSLTDPEQAHVTLTFLGETREEQLEEVKTAISDAVEAAGIGPFECAVGGLGVFPSLEYISVVWAGVGEGAGELAALHGEIEERTTALGFEAADHEFTPHFTIGRMNDARGKELVQRVVRNHEPAVGTFEVEEIRLKRSRLREDGPEYETIARFPLQD